MKLRHYHAIDAKLAEEYRHIERDDGGFCCSRCYVTSHDVQRGHATVAIPDGCGDEECGCHSSPDEFSEQAVNLWSRIAGTHSLPTDEHDAMLGVLETYHSLVIGGRIALEASIAREKALIARPSETKTEVEQKESDMGFYRKGVEDGKYLGKRTDPATPFRCPVCDGRGSLPHNFYTRATVASNLSDVECKACGGKGIVW